MHGGGMERCGFPAVIEFRKDNSSSNCAASWKMETERVRDGLSFRFLFGRHNFTVPTTRSNVSTTRPHAVSGTIIPNTASTSSYHWCYPPVVIYVYTGYSGLRCTNGIIFISSTNLFIEDLSGSAPMHFPLEVELYAIFVALRTLARRCYVTATILSESLQAVTYLNAKPSMWPWQLIQLHTDCMELWNRKDNITIAHISQNDNNHTHLLDHDSSTSLALTQWHSIPLCIQGLSIN